MSFLLVKQLEVDGNRVKLAIWVSINVRFLSPNSRLANYRTSDYISNHLMGDLLVSRAMKIH